MFWILAFLSIEELNKILLCLIVRLMKSHLIITPKSRWTAWACTEFSLCFLGIGLFSCTFHATAVDLQGVLQLF